MGKQDPAPLAMADRESAVSSPVGCGAKIPSRQEF